MMGEYNDTIKEAVARVEKARTAEEALGWSKKAAAKLRRAKLVLWISTAHLIAAFVPPIGRPCCCRSV